MGRFANDDELLKVWEREPGMLNDDEQELAASINRRRHHGRGFSLTILCDEMSPPALCQLLRIVANEAGGATFQTGESAAVLWGEHYTVEIKRVKANSRRRE